MVYIRFNISLLKIDVNNNYRYAIFTNVLYLKNIWVLLNNQEYIVFVNLQHNYVDFWSIFVDLILYSCKKNVIYRYWRNYPNYMCTQHTIWYELLELIKSSISGSCSTFPLGCKYDLEYDKTKSTAELCSLRVHFHKN